MSVEKSLKVRNSLIIELNNFYLKTSVLNLNKLSVLKA